MSEDKVKIAYQFVEQYPILEVKEEVGEYDDTAHVPEDLLKTFEVAERNYRQAHQALCNAIENAEDAND